MIKLAFLGDRHIDPRSPRYEHALSVWNVAIDDAIEQGVNVFVGLGDVCEGALSGEALYRVGRLYKQTAERCPTFEVLGNHEAVDGLRPFSLLGVEVAEDRILVEDLGACVLVGIPYPRRGRPPFDNLGEGLSIAESMQAAAQRIEAAIQKAVADAGGKPVIVAGHWSVEGMTTGASDYELHPAHEVIVPRWALDGVTLTIVGHIHKAQDRGPFLVGAGSLYHVSFGEADDPPKGYVLVTVHDDGTVTWQRRAVPAREMVVKRLAWSESLRQEIAAADPLFFGMSTVGKEVKLIVDIPEEQLSTFDPSAFDSVREGAALFTVEKNVITAQRTRAPEFAQSESLGAQLDAWYQAIGDAPIDEAHWARLKEKAAEVEASS